MTPDPPLHSALEKLARLRIKLPAGRVHLASYGSSRESERDLLGLIKAGTKTASASLAWSYGDGGAELPCQGDLEIVVNSDGEPELVTRISSVQVVPFSEVSSAHAAREGEGDKSLEHWQESHWQFFSKECEHIGRVPSPQMPVVCITFSVLHVVESG